MQRKLNVQDERTCILYVIIMMTLYYIVIGLSSLSLFQVVQCSSQKPFIDSVLHKIGPVDVNNWNVILVLIVPVLV